MKKQSRLFLTLAIIVGAISACSIAWSTAYPSGTWRYKVTVVVDTPEGVKTGSAVREVHARRQPKVMEMPGGTASAKGEAIVIDLGKRGLLFAVLGTNEYETVFNAFPGPPGLTEEGIKYYSHLKDAKAVIAPPMFVVFKDINNPLTVKVVRQSQDDVVEKVYGKENIESFSDAFGEGVSLREAQIEMTDEPITGGIEKYLPWLKALNGAYLNGEHHSRGAPLEIDAGFFKKGEN